MHFVVVESARSYLGTSFHPGGIPDLNLGSTAQVDARIAFFGDSPVHDHLKGAILLNAAEVGAIAIKNNTIIPDTPVLHQFLIGLILELL